MTDSSSSPLDDRVFNARMTLIGAAIGTLIVGLVLLPALRSLFSIPSFATKVHPSRWHIALALARDDLPVSAAIAATLLIIAVSLRRALRKTLARSRQNTVDGSTRPTGPSGPNSRASPQTLALDRRL